MQAKHGTQIVDVWQISDDMSPAVWVQDAFKQGLLHWDAREENTLMLNAPWSVAMGACGDFLTRDGQELRIVNENEFEKDYQIIDNQ